jgi:hypothetical protein
MKRILLIAGATIAAMSFYPTAFNVAPAQATEAAWCAVISLGPGAVREDCQYRTFEACRPVVLSGNRGFCNQNPRYTGPATASKSTRHKRRVNHD